MAISSFLSRAALALCLALPAVPALADGIEVHDAYARTAYPGAPTAAAFMVIRNQGGPGDQLIAARSPAAAVVELHTHIDAGEGVMQMREVEGGFPLPTDGEIVMERGGHHVMLMGVTRELSPGDTVPITLVFESGAEVGLQVEVISDADAMGHNTNDGPATMDHGAMGGDQMDGAAMDHGTMDHGN